MDVDTPEEQAARLEAHWATVPGDMERLAEQCCDEFHGEIGTFQGFADEHERERERDRWRKLAKFLWGSGARPSIACVRGTPLMTARKGSELPIAAVTRVLSRETGIVPSNVLAMQLIEAVRETTPPPRQVTIDMLTKILQSLDPTRALDEWASRASHEIVKILSRRPEVQHVAALVDDERLWCTLEGVVAGLLIRVCCGQDLDE